MLISLPYLRAGLRHYIFSISFRISSPFIIYILSNIMTLSIVSFLRALLFFALATSLATGAPVGPAGPAPQTVAKPLEQEKVFLSKDQGEWIREGPPVEANFCYFLIYTHVDLQNHTAIKLRFTVDKVSDYLIVQCASNRAGEPQWKHVSLDSKEMVGHWSRLVYSSLKVLGCLTSV